MAATMTVTLDGNPFLDGRGHARIIIDWISHTDGAVSLGIKSVKNTAEALLGGARIVLSKIRGVLRSIETAPGLNGDLTTLLPTAYDLTILDQYSYDILAGACMGRSATVAEKVLPTGSDIVIDTTELTITIATAGSGKKGRIIMELDAIDEV